MKNAWLEGKNIGKIPFLLILLLSPSLLFLLLDRKSKKPFDFLTALLSVLPYAFPHLSFAAALYKT